ncbi:MAG: branched chain amino acid aminotransferase, partial [Clostridia bacterium]|nr:branched chain amino acid aminotransferase [Clostridia bacterium]
MLDIKITRTQTPKEKPDQSKLGFGKIFTDHMFIMDYTEGKGWHDPRIEPYHNLSLSPASMVFHYGQEMFEGLKAYRGADGKARLFRPDMNGKRTNDTNKRLCIPELPVEEFVEAVKAVVKVDEDWIPTAP